MNQTQQYTAQEMATRYLEKKYEPYRNSFYEYMLYYREKEHKKPLDPNWHIKVICDKLEDVFYGRCKRLRINIPPRSLKTEIVSIAFPARCLGKRNSMKFIVTSYAAALAIQNSNKCRAMYLSKTYQSIFPRASNIRGDQDTKQYRLTEEGGQYYAAGSGGAITGFGGDIIILDDPLKPEDADSDVVRVGVNNNFHNTLESRLDDMSEGAIIVIMQRLHDDDLCGHLKEQEDAGEGEKREELVIKAIADEDDEYRSKGESFFPKRFPLGILYFKRSKDRQTFASQYQQEPTSKDTQEFHEEWFKYHGTLEKPTPANLRVFTTVDPAFKEGQENDQSCVMTVGFLGDKCYILEYSAGRYRIDQLQEKIIYHVAKRRPEKVGIEAFQAQSAIGVFLNNEMLKRGIYTQVEEIRQSGDKSSKLRKLVKFYKDGLIFHKPGMDDLESQLKKFPKGKHDDIIDALQMQYYLYTLQPNVPISRQTMSVSYGPDGQPLYR